MYPDVTHPWYTDNISVLGMFDNIELYFNSLKHFGPGQGYYTEPPKSVIIVHSKNFVAGKEFGLRHGLRFERARIIWSVYCG